METKIPPPLQALIIAGFMWLLSNSVAYGQLEVSGLNQYAALALVALGALVNVAAILSFRAAKTTVNPLDPSKASQLVDGGIFKLSRNPMYLGMLILLCAWSVFLGNFLNVLLLAVFVLYMNRFQITPEERALTTLFGDDYSEYCRRVRRWC